LHQLAVLVQARQRREVVELVDDALRALVEVSVSSTDGRLSTSAFARASAAGGKFAATYALPIGVRSAVSVAELQRCQRGSCSFTPYSTPLRNAKAASAKRLGNALAYESTTWKRRYVVQVAGGVAASSACGERRQRGRDQRGEGRGAKGAHGRGGSDARRSPEEIGSPSRFRGCMLAEPGPPVPVRKCAPRLSWWAIRLEPRITLSRSPPESAGAKSYPGERCCQSEG
jgi:hypothetical protein